MHCWWEYKTTEPTLEDSSAAFLQNQTSHGAEVKEGLWTRSFSTSKCHPSLQSRRVGGGSRLNPRNLVRGKWLAQDHFVQGIEPQILMQTFPTHVPGLSHVLMRRCVKLSGHHKAAHSLMPLSCSFHEPHCLGKRLEPLEGNELICVGRIPSFQRNLSAPI